MVFRETAALSPQMLASRTGITVAYIRRLETGQANPSIVKLQRIATALDTTVQELLDVEGDELGIAAAQTKPV